MHTTKQSVKKLLSHYQEIALLDSISSVLNWDLNVNLPSKASQTRAEQIAYMTKTTTEKWQDPKLLELLENVKKEKNLNTEEKAVVRNLEHSLKYYSRIPKDLIVEFSKVTSLAFMAWNVAREKNDFNEFLPHLKSVIKLNQIFAQHLKYKDDPYDALLDLYEPGLTTKQCKEFFDAIKKPLTDLILTIVNSKNYNEDPQLVGKGRSFPQDRQTQLSHFILKKIGYDLQAGRLDVSPHPFTTGLGDLDVRITTAYKSYDFRDSLTASIHEGGHALYEQGVKPEYANTPLGGGVSLGIHESQSRFWENQIGRNPEFLKFVTPLLHAFFPSLETADHDKITLVFNHVKPDVIRIEADEVTYNLHIILRFELEQQLISGDIEPEDLPEAWNEKMRNYLNIVPPSDSQGVLQDVHWSYGSFGYFPTYTLGNLYSAQIRSAMLKEFDYEKDLSKGDLGKPLAWLRSHIHQHGSLYLPDELIKKATGETLNTSHYLTYITQKYSELYNL